MPTTGFDTDTLLDSIKLRSQIPDGALTDAELLTLASDEIRSGFVPLIMEHMEGYYIHATDVAYTSTKTYRIPERAAGGKVNGVWTVDSAGVENRLPRLTDDDFAQGRYGFRFVANSVVVSDNVGTFTSLRFRFFHRPNELVTIGAGVGATVVLGVITNIVGAVVTTDTDVTGVTSFDFIKGTSGFEPVLVDQTGARTGVNTYTMSTAPTTAAVGDYLYKAGYTEYPQLPADLHPILAQRVAVTALQLLGYDVEVERQLRKLKEMEEALNIFLTPRADSSPKKVINRNGF